MNSVHLASSASRSAIQPDSDRTLTFQGKSSVTIPAGESVLSDTFNFNLAPLSDLAVTIDFGGTSPAVTGHPGSRTTSYLQAGDSVSALDLPNAAKTEHWYILTGIDVEADTSSAAIVTLGDSITDGRGSGTDKNDRWPDNLARRLQADKPTAQIAVLNAGIGGNCVLRGGLGPTALARFERDVLSQSGVRWLIVLEGVNDIGGSRDASVATNLIAAYDKMIEQACLYRVGFRVARWFALRIRYRGHFWRFDFHSAKLFPFGLPPGNRCQCRARWSIHRRARRRPPGRPIWPSENVDRHVSDLRRGRSTVRGGDVGCNAGYWPDDCRTRNWARQLKRSSLHL